MRITINRHFLKRVPGLVFCEKNTTDQGIVITLLLIGYSAG